MGPQAESDPSAEEARQIGIDGYIYLYPLITMEITRRQLTSGPENSETGRGPMGTFHHVRRFPDAEFKAVVRPNFDTLYSTAWLDVGTEPMIVSVPASDGRYYLLPCYDMWTDAFASPGTRTSGPDPFSFALTSPAWSGALPEGVERIEAPTPTVWIIGRTQTNGPRDYPAVWAFQDGLSIKPLSSWGGPTPTQPVSEDPTVDTVRPPLDQVNGLSAGDYFALGAELMATHPAHATDWNIVARMRRIGFEVGRPFDPATKPESVQRALATVAADCQALLASRLPQLAPVEHGWLNNVETMGVYGIFYVKRAVVAMVGLGANQPEDAIYPMLVMDSDGHPPEGSNRYLLHFDADQLPPVEAFWSVTMYDAAGFQVANELNRFAIGDRDDLTFNADGSLDLYLQHESPGVDKVSNWLPTPKAALGVTMRLYQPGAEVLSGAWTPPDVRKVN